MNEGKSKRAAQAALDYIDPKKKPEKWTMTRWIEHVAHLHGVSSKLVQDAYVVMLKDKKIFDAVLEGTATIGQAQRTIADEAKEALKK